MLAEVPNWISDAGAIAVAITAVLVLGTMLLRSKPGRWLIRELREEAAEHRLQEMRQVLDVAMPAYLAPVLYELRANGGVSFRDQVIARLERIDNRQDEADVEREDIRHLVEDFSRIERDTRPEGP